MKSFWKGEGGGTVGTLPVRTGVESKGTPWCAPQRERMEGGWVDEGVREVSLVSLPWTYLCLISHVVRQID